MPASTGDFIFLPVGVGSFVCMFVGGAVFDRITHKVWFCVCSRAFVCDSLCVVAWHVSGDVVLHDRAGVPHQYAVSACGARVWGALSPSICVCLTFSPSFSLA